MDAAVFKVQKTLGAIAANVRTEIGKWEERNDAASNALSRLEGILERSAAVRAAGIPEATKLGTRSARHAVQPTPTGGAGAGAGVGSGTGSSTGGVQVDDESKSSKVQVQVQGGWGKLSAIKGLPLALARVLAKDTERWAKAVTAEMDALVRQLSLSLSLPHLLFLSPFPLALSLRSHSLSTHAQARLEPLFASPRTRLPLAVHAVLHIHYCFIVFIWCKRYKLKLPSPRCAARPRRVTEGMHRVGVRVGVRVRACLRACLCACVRVCVRAFQFGDLKQHWWNLHDMRRNILSSHQIPVHFLSR